MKKRVIILGSTGSIGRSTLDVLARLEPDWTVVGLAAGSRVDQLFRQAAQCRPNAVAVARPNGTLDQRSALGYAPTILTGETALADLISTVECDYVVSAVVGAGGLRATLRAVELGRRIALASKEAMVIAGAVLMPLAHRTGASIIPIDSEHSGIFQAMQAGHPADVQKVYLTASGGPFRTWTREKLDRATVAEALKHPTWNMGPKITIDSATMMNKALEIVEARWLFDLRPEQIGVVIHPESVIHSLVEFRDGSVMAQLGMPDMRTPIQYALTHPQRKTCPAERLDFTAVQQFNFHPPDLDRFPALRLGHEVAKRGGTCGAVLNAANEAAVELFREGAIPYPDIARHTEWALSRHEFDPSPTFADLLKADRWAREEVTRCIAC
ncbi:MAG: 1-deoxy-D-xylulose-5-phosphate reductoisomerase [Phycisphaerae bacterium]|jgi:1-deoxy-D-xylulose-5-phosphate reductoisomerase